MGGAKRQSSQLGIALGVWLGVPWSAGDTFQAIIINRGHFRPVEAGNGLAKCDVASPVGIADGRFQPTYQVIEVVEEA